MSPLTTQNSSIFTNSTDDNLASFGGAEYRELNLSIPEDLDTFSKSVKDSYDEVIKYKQYAESEQYKSLDVEDIVGEDIFKTFIEKFHSLEQKVNKCKEMQSREVEIPDNWVEEMQVSYNDLACLKNYVLETYENITLSTKGDFDTKKILEKADKIIDDLSSATETPHGILHKATDLYEDVKDAELNFSQDSSKLLEAYKKLEDFARAAVKEQLVTDVQKSDEHEIPVINAQIHEVFDEIKVTPTLRRKTMQIISDNEEGNISITVARQAEEIIESSEPEVINHAIVKSNLNNSENSALASIETKDPINAAVKNLPNNESNWQKPQKKSLVSEFIVEEIYLDLIKNNYDSVESFDRVLGLTVIKIEKSTEDAFERWLGEKHFSPFLYLKNMKLSEVEKLANSSNTREVVAAKNIKYETFLIWVDLMYQMLELVGDVGDIKFGKLYVLWMIECNSIK